MIYTLALIVTGSWITCLIKNPKVKPPWWLKYLKYTLAIPIIAMIVIIIGAIRKYRILIRMRNDKIQKVHEENQKTNRPIEN